jgi:hypothetical protein
VQHFAKALAARWFLARLVFEPEDGDDTYSKSRFSYGLIRAISKEMAKFITNAVITSNPTNIRIDQIREEELFHSECISNYLLHVRRFSGFTLLRIAAC